MSDIKPIEKQAIEFIEAYKTKKKNTMPVPRNWRNYER